MPETVARLGLTSELEQYLKASDEVDLRVGHLVSQERYYSVRILLEASLPEDMYTAILEAKDTLNVTSKSNLIEISSKDSATKESIKEVQEKANSVFEILKDEGLLRQFD